MGRNLLVALKPNLPKITTEAIIRIVSAIFLARRVIEGMALIFLARRVIERFQMAESLERTMRLTYNEFRKAHKGTVQKENSELWKRYKANEYDLPPELLNEAPVEEVKEEVPRAETEVKVVKTLKKKSKVDSNPGLQSYIAHHFG